MNKYITFIVLALIFVAGAFLYNVNVAANIEVEGAVISTDFPLLLAEKNTM